MQPDFAVESRPSGLDERTQPTSIPQFPRPVRLRATGIVLPISVNAQPRFQLFLMTASR